MKKRWFWLMAAVVVAVGVGVWANRPAKPPTVKTTVLTPTQVEQTVSCNGVVEAVDGVGVFAPVSCHIREVCVTAGQRVKKGDVLAVVDKEATYADTGDVATQVVLAAMEEELTAPEDGIVVEVTAQAGQTLEFGTPCVLLVLPCDLQVRIAIREKDLRVLQEGMSVRISGDGFEQAFYNGCLTEISGAASADSSAIVVEGVVLPDAGQTDDSFRLGLSAKATVITSIIEEGYLIPYEAVLADEQGSYIYILQDGKAHLRRVEGAVQVPRGLLMTDDEMADMTVIMEPEKVAGDGTAVTEAVS